MTSSKVAIMSPRFSRIYNSYYEELAKSRENELYDISVSFVTDILSNIIDLSDKYYYVVNAADLAHLVKSYFIDVIRYKDLHFSPNVEGLNNSSENDEDVVHRAKTDGGKYLDIYKQAAFMVKWIIKIKPIMIMPRRVIDVSKEYPEPTPKEIDAILTVNETFAAIVASAILCINNIQTDPEFLNRFIYNLHYRSYDEGHFAEFFTLMKSHYQKGTI